jgi:hypothetical protein
MVSFHCVLIHELATENAWILPKDNPRRNTYNFFFSSVFRDVVYISGGLLAHLANGKLNYSGPRCRHMVSLLYVLFDVYPNLFTNASLETTIEGTSPWPLVKMHSSLMIGQWPACSVENTADVTLKFFHSGMCFQMIFKGRVKNHLKYFCKECIYEVSSLTLVRALIGSDPLLTILLAILREFMIFFFKGGKMSL